MTREQLDALDRMDLIASCWQAVSVLMSPDRDALCDKGREEVATLTLFLTQEYEAARAALEGGK
ncbi:MAG TPA: hypothetical protein PK011_17270 [Marinagarivorans sp.]|nr:hypothetical protein [Cellvibrionaceae bacterium]HMY41079.1 hypothetical protein [Marinagarivorans sp.]